MNSTLYISRFRNRIHRLELKQITPKEKKVKPEKETVAKHEKKHQNEPRTEVQTEISLYSGPDLSPENLRNELKELEDAMPLERKLALILWEFRPRKEHGFVPVGINTRNHCSYGLKAYCEKPAPQVTEITYYEY